MHDIELIRRAITARAVARLGRPLDAGRHALIQDYGKAVGPGNRPLQAHASKRLVEALTGLRARGAAPKGGRAQDR